MRQVPRALVKFNSFTFTRKEVIIVSNSLLVGIDVSLNDNKVRILHPDGTSLSKFTVPNSVPGAKTLSQKITGVMEKNRFDDVVIGLESTSVYGDPLYIIVSISIQLFQYGFHIVDRDSIVAAFVALNDHAHNFTVIIEYRSAA